MDSCSNENDILSGEGKKYDKVVMDDSGGSNVGMSTATATVIFQAFT